MSPRPRVAPQRRQQIVEALFRCLARKSYGEVSVTDIAREAGVARGAINFFFRSKAEILAALLERAIGDYRATLRAILDHPRPAGRHLRAVLEALLAPTRATRQTMVVFLNYYALGPGHPELAGPLRDFFREYRRVFVLLIRRGVRQGRYPRGTDAEQSAALLVAAVEGLLIQWVADPHAVNLARAIPRLERLVEPPGEARPLRAAP